jgi:hypothetical protein
MDSALAANLNLPLIVRDTDLKSIRTTEMVYRLVVLLPHVFEGEVAFRNEDIQFKSFEPVWSRVVEHSLFRKHFADNAQQFGFSDSAFPDSREPEPFTKLAAHFLKVVPE